MSILLILSIRWGEQRPRPEHAAVGKNLNLRGFTSIPGTDGFRAELSEETPGVSSYGYRVRNILFVDGTGESRWLLPDDDHVIEELSVSPEDVPKYDTGHARALLGFVLAKPAKGKDAAGTLYVFDPSGRRTRRVAESVLEMHGASLAPNNTGAVLYEGPSGYVLAYYDIATLAKTRESLVTVPRLE